MKRTLLVVLCVLVVVFEVVQIRGEEDDTPLVCYSPAAREEAVKFANSISKIVGNNLKLAANLIKDPAKKADYLDVSGTVMEALENGWGAEGACDSIANPIADPMKVIPFVGETLVAPIVRIGVKAACEKRKKQLGC